MFSDSFIDVSGNYEMSNKYDEYLLDDLNKELNNDSTNRKKFIALHTWGSHSRYIMRYTDKFKVFTPVPGDESNRFDREARLRDKVVNSYDNSILYTDFILSQIIKEVDSLHQSSVVVYISDHGENLYDDERDLAIHTKRIPTKYELQVPMFIWYSDSYYKYNKELIDNIQSNKSSKITSEVVFHTLGSLGGFESNFYNNNLDLTLDKKLSYKRLFYTVDYQVISTDSILEIENKIKPYFE
jgi:glucan phosphoethanolaminetransferase (alkaline phosphatase superfamily)